MDDDPAHTKKTDTARDTTPNNVEIHNEKKDGVTEFLNSLEDDDDVQNVFSNVNLEVN